MRKLKIALFVISAAISLFSLRDKAVVTTVPHINPPVAEAYHAPAGIQPQSISAENLIAPSAAIKTPFQSLNDSTSSSSDFIESDLPSQDQENYIVGSEPAKKTLPDAPKEEPKTPLAAKAPETIIYAGGYYQPPDDTDDDGSDLDVDKDDTPPGDKPKDKSQDGVFVTSLTPNSGIPKTGIIIQGAGFSSTLSDNTINFGSTTAAPGDYVSKNQISAAVPEGLPAGLLKISVSVGGAKSNPFTFDILKNSAANVFTDKTRDVLPAGMTLTDSSIVRSADVDNDSDLDIFIIDASAGAAHLLINNGRGVFTGAVSASLPAIPDPSLITDAVFGDVNKDGYPDILLSYSSGQSVRMLLNDGSGKFSDVTGAKLPAVSGDAAGLDLGDSNGDGAPDIVIANKDARDVMLINDGAGSFSIDTNFNLPGVIDGSSDIRFCDIDGDGDLDIITTNNSVVAASSLRNRVYINDGLGQFTDNTANVLPEDNEYSEVLDCGDIDADGDIDIVVANDNRNAVLINNGSGVFEDQADARVPTNDFESKDTKLGDMNGDGYLDIVMLGDDKTSLLINDGQGSFEEGSIKLPDYKSVPAILGGKNIQVADIDGDGSLDIIIGGESFYVLMSTASNSGGLLPMIDHYVPDKLDFNLTIGQIVQFGIHATDPNGGQLTFKWFLNGVEIPAGSAATSSIIFIVPRIGGNTVEAKVSNSFGTDSLQWNITVGTATQNLPPSITSFSPNQAVVNIDLSAGGGFSFSVTAADPELDTLSYAWKFNNAELPPSGANLSSIAFLGSVGVAGDYPLEVSVSDGHNLSVKHIWTIHVTGASQNQPPSITGFSPNLAVVDVDLSAGGGFSFGVTATDPEHDTLLYTWKFNNVLLAPSEANLSSSAFMGSVGVVGNYPLEVSVSDGHNPAVKHSWTIHVTGGSTNHAPTAVNDSITVNINIATDIDVLANDSDSDGNAITISATSLTQPSHGTAAIVGNKIRYAPANNYSGSDSFTYKSTDGSLESASATVTVTVNAVNHAPTAVNDSITVNINIATDIDVLANDSDSDGNALTISATGLTQPSHGTAAIVGNKIRYAPANNYAGSDSFTYKATDGSLESASATVTVMVEESVADQLIKRAFSYFWNETANSGTGFTRDRLAVDALNRNSSYDTSYNMASMAATGFSLSAMCIAAEKYGGPDSDWPVAPDQLKARADLIMTKLLGIQNNQNNLNPDDMASKSLWGKDGFFYHFVNIDTGERWIDSGNRSEVSTIDTAILIAGVLTAGEYFGGETKDRALQIYRNVDWNAFLDKNLTVPNHHIAANLNYNQMYHAWNPDRPAADRFYGHWDYTSECLLLYLLAAVSPESGHEIPPETFYAIRKELGNYGANGNPMIKSWFGSLFVYQYTQAFFNFKDAAGKPLYDKEGVDWWKNSVEAVKANKQFCNDIVANYAGSEDLWGLTSGYTGGFNYDVYGAPPAGVEIPSVDVRGADGTVHPSAIVGSLPMLSEECVRALNKMKELYDTYGHQVWGDYGFVNSFKMGAGINETPSPISSFYCAIDIGISLVMAENHNSGLIWNRFSNFEVEQGKTLKDAIIEKIGFTSDNTCVISVNDSNPESNFHIGQIDAVNSVSTIRFNLDEVGTDPYLLAVHSFMAKDIGNHTVTVTIKVNDGAGAPVTFDYDAAANPASLMKYVQIDPANLKAGDNTITLQWQSATGSAKWLAWKNIEVSSPIVNSVWSISRNEIANPPALFGSEYRVDDTYYIGAPIGTFEQAVNKDVETFTDILFYMTPSTAECATLTLKALETDKDAKANARIFVNGEPDPVFSGSLASSDQVTTSSFQLINGWNRITIYHPGASEAAPGEWIRWESMNLTAANPSKFNPPQGLSAASLGPDKVNLRWKVVKGIDVRYNIYRSQTSGGVYTKINGAPLTSTQYQDTGLTGGAAYYYSVTACADADPLSTESDRSIAASKTTGAYDIDYRDGLDPNSFGGVSSSQFTYTAKYRHDWTDGAVRKVTLIPQESGWIGLAGVNIGQANALSLWIYGTGTEKIEVGLQNTGSGPSTFAVTTSAGWQNLRIKLSDLSGVLPVNLDKLSIKNTSTEPITVFLDDISFVNDAAGAAVLDVIAKNVSDNSLSTGMSFANDNVNSYGPGNQYLAVSYNSPSAANWKIWIYTKNDNGDPQYMGGQYNGLMSSDGHSRVALIWRVYNTVQQGGVACRTTSDVYNSDKMTWNYLKDRNDSDWLSSNPTAGEYSVAAFGKKNEWAWIAPVPPGFGNRSPIDKTFYVYLGGEFGSANPGDYSARIYLDITNE